MDSACGNRQSAGWLVVQGTHISTAALIAVAILHAVASLDQGIKGEFPLALMLLGFTIADLAMIWAAYWRT